MLKIGKLSASASKKVSHRLLRRNYQPGVPLFEQSWRSLVPIAGAFIGVCAFSFQVFVLYPWHHELSNQFEELQKVVIKLQNVSEELDGKMNAVLHLEEEVKAKERKILQKEDEILLTEKAVAAKLDELINAHKICDDNDKTKKLKE